MGSAGARARTETTFARSRSIRGWSASTARATSGEVTTSPHSERTRRSPPRSRARWVCSRSRPTVSDADAALRRRAISPPGAHRPALGADRWFTNATAPASASRVSVPAFRTGRTPGPQVLTCYASSLIRDTVDIKRVQSYLGHHSATFTLDTYGHLMPTTRKRRCGRSRPRSA